jgi:hypothetical protein
VEDGAFVLFVVSIKGEKQCFGDRKRTLEKISLYFPLLAR